MQFNLSKSFNVSNDETLTCLFLPSTFQAFHLAFSANSGKSRKNPACSCWTSSVQTTWACPYYDVIISEALLINHLLFVFRIILAYFNTYICVLNLKIKIPTTIKLNFIGGFLLYQHIKAAFYNHSNNIFFFWKNIFKYNTFPHSSFSSLLRVAFLLPLHSACWFVYQHKIVT